MKVALDVNALYVSRAGTARYLNELWHGFSQCPDLPLTIEKFAWEVENYGYRQPQRALRTAYREFIWASLVAPRRLRRSRFDLLHSVSGGLVSPSLFAPQVSTLLDMGIYSFPERFRRWHRLATRHRMEWIRRARRILCISRFAADEAHRIMGLPYRQMEVVHLGADSLDREEAIADPSLRIPDDFFLFVGHLAPNKNLPLLREAYALAESKGIRLPPLLLVGTHWTSGGPEGEPPSGWHFLGRQPDGVLKHLYLRARALLFPSLYEGFGLPPIEAMHLGCPVICGRVTSLPEVCGEAAVYAPLEREGYLGAMLRLQDDAARAEAVAKGRERAAGFRWKKCAEETARVYLEAA